MMKSKTIVTFFILLSVVFISCERDKNNPGYAYMADYDMYYTKFAKAYAPNDVLPNGMVNQPLPDGAVARNSVYYPFHPTSVVEKVQDQERAGKVLKNPVPATKENLAEGKRQYDIFCADCHGIDLKGNGHLYSSGLYPAKPRDLTGDYVQNLPDGSIYFIITEGSLSGLMGPHGTQVTPENRWKIVNYIRSVVK
jgi:mono/diheme cytochrome c family protein